MPLVISKNQKVDDYAVATVYLKNSETPKVALGGGVVSVDTDGYTVTIKTKTTLASFDTSDVVAVILGQ